MRSTLRGWLLALAAVLVCGLANTARAADDNKHVSATDQRVYDTLRDIINEGADLYNPPNNDVEGCYRLYEGALKMLESLGHEDWNKAIGEGLAEANRTPSVAARAFVLRGVIDRIRNDIHPKKGETTTTKPSTEGTGTKPAPQTTGTKPAPETTKPTTLWDRLGGEKGVSKVVDDFTNLAAKDPKVDFTRGGKIKLTPEAVAKFKKEMVAWISFKTNGPIPYTGESMKQAHKGMGITNAQFDASIADLREALEKNGVKGADLNAVLGAAERTRSDIVEKTGSETKPEEKKPEKSGEKKSTGTNKQ